MRLNGKGRKREKSEVRVRFTFRERFGRPVSPPYTLPPLSLPGSPVDDEVNVRALGVAINQILALEEARGPHLLGQLGDLFLWTRDEGSAWGGKGERGEGRKGGGEGVSR